jgi:hypothetical protein
MTKSLGQDMKARFVSQVSPLFKPKNTMIEAVVPEVSLHELTRGKRFLLPSQTRDSRWIRSGTVRTGRRGEERRAPLSGSTVVRLKKNWRED